MRCASDVIELRGRGRKGGPPCFTDGPGALRAGGTWLAGVDEGGALARVVDPLKVDDERARVVLGVSEDLGAEEGDDVVRDDLDGLGLEIGIVDAKMAVEPVDLVRDELAGNEALKMERVRQLVRPSPTRAEWTLRGSSCTIGRWA